MSDIITIMKKPRSVQDIVEAAEARKNDKTGSHPVELLYDRESENIVLFDPSKLVTKIKRAFSKKL